MTRRNSLGTDVAVAVTPTHRLYLDDDHALSTDATILAVHDGRIACERTCLYPGGGGQPCDFGEVRFADGRSTPIVSVDVDENGIIWHGTAAGALGTADAVVGTTARLIVDAARRHVLTRYHTVLHVLNTVAMRNYGAWITGVQIGTEYSRIDFKWEGFSPSLRDEIARSVNAVLAEDRRVASAWMAEDEFRSRDDLLRTLEVRPPVIDGRIRVVTIDGFDAQACGGTHVRATAEVGRFEITRTENKGRINKRVYVRLDPPPG